MRRAFTSGERQIKRNKRACNFAGASGVLREAAIAVATFKPSIPPMKRTLLTSLLGLSLVAALPLSSLAASSGEVDFGQFMPAASGEFVEVDLNPALLTFAARVAASEEPEAAELLKAIRRVRVNVVTLDEGNRADTTERIARIREDLKGQGWERVVTAKAKAGEDVAIHAKMNEAGGLEGLVVTVIEGSKQAVLVNVVGDINPDKLVELGRRFDIDVLKRTRMAAKQ